MNTSRSRLLLVLTWFAGITLSRSEGKVGAIKKLLDVSETFQWENTETKNGKPEPVWNGGVTLLKTWKNEQNKLGSTFTFIMNCAKKVENRNTLHRAILYIQGVDGAYISMKTMDVKNCGDELLKSVSLTIDLEKNAKVINRLDSGDCKHDLYNTQAKEYDIEGEVCSKEDGESQTAEGKQQLNGWKLTSNVPNEKLKKL